MKKLLVAALVVVLLGAAGAGWYVWVRPHDRLALARSLMSKGDAPGARLALRSAVLADPTNAEAHFRLGEVQLSLGDPVAAEKELTDARQRGWDDKAILPPMAQAVLAQGRYAEVLASFSPDGLAPDKAAMVLVARSDAALALHQNKAAADAAMQAEQLAPHAVGPALASAAVAAANHDPAGSERAIGRALAIEPHSLSALTMLAEARQRAGDNAGALAALTTALTANPAAEQQRFERAQLLIQMNQDAAAREDVATVLKRDPRNPLANYLQADLLARAHDFTGADAAMETVGPAVDQVPRGQMLLAIIKANVNQPEQAAEAAGHYLGRAPGDPAAYKLVALLAMQAHRPADAADVLNRAVAGDHADAVTYDMLGRAESQLGHGDAALSALQQAAALAPKDPAILGRLATLHLGRGDASGAADDLQHMLDMQPATPTPPAATDVASRSAGALAGAPAVAAAPTSAPSSAQTAASLVLASLQAGEVDRAAAALERLRKLGAGAVQMNVLTGLLRAAQLDLPGAQHAYAAALADPAITPAQAVGTRINLANVLGLQGRQDEAEATLRQALATDPGNEAALSALERLLLRAGRTDDAVKTLETAHAAAPGSVPLIVALADLYGRTGHADRALQLLDTPRPPSPPPPAGAPQDAAAAQQADLTLQAARAQAQLTLGHRKEAEAGVRQLLAARPRDLQLRRELIGLLLGDKDVASAQAVIDEGLAAQPGTPVLLSMSAVAALQAGGVPAAIERADMLARDPANLPTARLLKGEIYMDAKQFPQALDAFTAELRTGDAPSSVALGAAAAARAAGQPDQAAGLLRAYLATHPDAADVAGALGVVEIDARHLDSARTVLQQVLAKQPNNPAALNNLAWVDQQLHQPEQARAMAQRSWLLSPSPQAADTLGWVLLGGESGPPAPGQGAAALDLLRQAAAGLPSDPSVQYHFAAALKANGQDQRAATILARLTKLPPFDEQKQARTLLESLPHG